MSSSFRKGTFFASLFLFFSTAVYAEADHHGVGMSMSNDGLKKVHASDHAPIGVMGEHMHKKGEWMLSYRYMYMDMQGNRIGEKEVSPEFIISNVTNRFGTPANLRIVPTEMTMDMHMFGAMYAPSDWLTLMVMGMYGEKSMDHVTFNGAGERIGTFNTESRGISDTKISGLVKLLDNRVHNMHLNLGISLPTGNTDKKDDILAPTGATPTVRLPYAMQIGSGTFDLLPGITYYGREDKFNWGAQYTGTFRTGRDNGYSLGDKHELTGWLAYNWKPWFSTSARLSYKDEDKIDGIDSRIAGPVQTADPDNYGGESAFIHLGVNLAGQSGHLRGHRLAIEAGIPIYQDLNGPQMETDLVITGGWQFAF